MVKQKNIILLTWKHFLRLKWKETKGILIFLFVLIGLTLLPYLLGSLAWKVVNPDFFADCTSDYHSKSDGDYCRGDMACSCTIAIENPNKMDVWDKWCSGLCVLLGLGGLMLLFFGVYHLCKWLKNNWRKAKRMAEAEIKRVKRGNKR